jgi:hypothetical protein
MLKALLDVVPDTTTIKSLNVCGSPENTTSEAVALRVTDAIGV